MLLYDNAKITIASKQRCGHTAMYNYFNLPKQSAYGTIEQWNEHTNKVIVLRHPIERVWSAVAWYDKAHGGAIEFYDHTKDFDATVDYLYQEFFNKIPEERRAFNNIGLTNVQAIVRTIIALDEDSRLKSKNEIIYAYHCDTYMSKIIDSDFRYIPFERLIDYIPKLGLITDMTNRSLDGFDENNGHFTLDDLKSETEIYYKLLGSKNIITPEEWKELTT